MLQIDSAEISSPEGVGDRVSVCRFSPCSSTSLELKTLLWALGELGADAPGVTVYTDSQTIVGLLERRSGLESTGFCSRGGKLLSQASLYREFYDAYDRLTFGIVKLKGHRPKSEKSREELLFTSVDRASRSALRADRDILSRS